MMMYGKGETEREGMQGREESLRKTKIRYNSYSIGVPLKFVHSPRDSAVPPRPRTGALDALLDLPISFPVDPVQIILPSAIAP